MKYASLALFVLSILLAGCSRSAAPSPLPPSAGGIPPVSSGGAIADAAPYNVIYSFGKQNDAAFPHASLIVRNATFYGTTLSGGTFSYGAVFSVTPSGTERVIHSLRPANGAGPEAPLLNVNGSLYGTAYREGAHNEGTVFDPGRLIARNGVLFGTTATGGANNKGTVFRLNPSGKETELYSFHGGDGAYPRGGVTVLNGVLYGTTSGGGAHDVGTVFKLTLAGQESVLYSFRGGTKACAPTAELTVASGALYGTTTEESDSKCTSPGTIFKITTAGVETTLHVYGTGPGGGDPESGVVVLNGKLYGTTSYFGAYKEGVVYSSGE